ncbi:MAG: class I SAM-dependent methyltransferase [Actinomycetota bacterium]|nr:class I SAM-dependent methyltransferase [Actinomycetota bacterium]
MSELEQLNERYREHHRAQRGREFVFGGDERADHFRRIVGGPGKRVLDVGCRYGALTRAYAEGNDVVGVDVDREALEEAARELAIETHWANVDDGLAFEDASFDVVVAGELLEHIRDPERLVAEARRVLRPGGTFVASVPNAYRLKNRVRFMLGRNPEENPTHLHMFTPDEVRKLLEGFERPALEYVVGRYVRAHPRLMANVIVFSGVKPA